MSGNLPEETRALHTEYVALLLLKLVSWVTGDDVHATEAQFTHRRLADEAEYQRVFCCPIRFQRPESTVLLSKVPSSHASSGSSTPFPHRSMRQVAPSPSHAMDLAIPSLVGPVPSE